MAHFIVQITCLILALQIYLARESLVGSFKSFVELRTQHLADPQTALEGQCAKGFKSHSRFENCDITTYIRASGHWTLACQEPGAWQKKLIPPRYYKIRWRCAGIWGLAPLSGETTLFR